MTGIAPGALGVCIGSDRAHGYALAKDQLFRTLDDVNPNPAITCDTPLFRRLLR